MIRLRNITTFTLALFTILIITSCQQPKDVSDHKIFNKLEASQTAIDFNNTLTENDSLNYFTYSYLYMGGGVATGDINNDGLVDIFLTGNQVSNKLYLNKGNLTFEDITEKAGLTGDSRWYTGVTMADVNGDGFLDIYCSVSGKFPPHQNQLFINNGNLTFSEEAKKFGLDDAGESVQSTFFDYDRDGDLDLYIANYPATPFSSPTFVYTYKMNNPKDIESNQLYRNDGDTFTKVTKAAGVLNFSLSLSATIGDLNNDGWQDIYVSNDFNSPDFLYLNNQDGTFKETVKEATGHTAFYGMGVDIADANNDGYLDVFQVDMDAQTNRRKKANMASMNIPLFWSVIDAGFHYQYMHNCFQLNSGVMLNGIPQFSNVSRITGTSSTDWSWAPLFADFDNDGFKDLFVSNGTRREINNNDFFNAIKNTKKTKDTLLALSKAIPAEKIDNVMYQNQGNLNFKQVNTEWGIEFKGFSNGTAYADLDNDGDLELIINNIDDPVSIFKNNSSESHHYLQIKFKGNTTNPFGLGARVYVSTTQTTQMQELTLTRGFQSSVSPILHFGLGKAKLIDSLKVVWPNGKIQKLNTIEANQRLTLNISDAIDAKHQMLNTSPLFVTDTTRFPKHKHLENDYDDFAEQVLLPHRMSALGPALAVGDLNGDAKDDYFIGGAANTSGALYLQSESEFTKQPAIFLTNDAPSEDLDALIFDADLDGDNDLYVVSGGYEFETDDNRLKDRLYLNDGKGQFTKADESVINSPPISGSKAYKGDFNNDGKPDILVLGRQVPKHYPEPASSYILINKSEQGIPKFEITTTMQPKAFQNLGMATSAVITDINNDNWQDIIVVGEWMPIRVFKNTQNGFKEVSEELGLTKDTSGWWWSIAEGDFDNDGDMDYILGNNGLNYKYKATEDETFDIYVNDFDRNSKNDIVLSYYNDGKQYPVRGRQCSSQQIPGITSKFKNYESFSTATLSDVYSKKALKDALHYQVKSFASIYLENNNGQLTPHKLPIEAQLSNSNQVLVDDYDNDGHLDALLVQNLYTSEVETPRNDAGYGLFLKGNGKGQFDAISPRKSGFFVKGDVKNMAPITINNQTYILMVKNDELIQSVRLQKQLDHLYSK